MARRRNGNDKKEPVHKLRAWTTGTSAVEVAAWGNDNGFSVTWHRSYKKGDEWMKAPSLFP